MAEIVRDDNRIIVRLSLLERLIAFRFRALAQPVGSVVDVRTVDDPWTQVRGVAPLFTSAKEKFAVGTRRGLFGKDFTAVYGMRRAVVVDFEHERFCRFVVTTDEPEDAAALLRG
jgi:hypothetical protein